MQQLELTAVPIARRTDPHTSHEAAKSLRAEKISALQLQLLLALTVAPKTDRELEASFPTHSPSSVRSRRSELVRMGKVKNSGRTQRLPSGRYGIVWEAV